MVEDGRRKRLFRCLGIVLNVSEEKFKMDRGITNKERQGWGRLMVSAVDSYGSLLKESELEEMAKDIELIKEKIGLKT